MSGALKRDLKKSKLFTVRGRKVKIKSKKKNRTSKI